MKNTLPPVTERFPGIVPAFSADDLGTSIIEVVIERQSRAPVAVAMGTLTHKEFMQIGVTVSDPSRLPNRIDPLGRENADGTPRMVFDPDYGGWNKKYEEAKAERLFRRLLACLLRVPADYEWESVPGQVGPVYIPGETEEEQLAYIMDEDTGFDFATAAQLSNCMLNAGGQASVIVRAHSFHRLRDGGDENSNGAGMG